MKAILLPRNYLNFPLVTLIVSKIAYKSLQNTNIVHFLRMVPNDVREDFSDISEDSMYRTLFKPIRIINHANSSIIWTRTSKYMEHFLKKN